MSSGRKRVSVILQDPRERSLSHRCRLSSSTCIFNRTQADCQIRTKRNEIETSRRREANRIEFRPIRISLMNVAVINAYVLFSSRLRGSGEGECFTSGSRSIAPLFSQRNERDVPSDSCASLNGLVIFSVIFVRTGSFSRVRPVKSGRPETQMRV